MESRRHIGSRLLSTLLALVLLLVQGGIEPVHACPVHDAQIAAATSQTPANHHSPAHAEEDTEHCCTCLGSCVVSAPTILAPVAAGIRWDEVATHQAPTPGRDDLPKAPSARLLPFANAPPHAVLV